MALPRYKVTWVDPHHEFASEFDRRQHGGLRRSAGFDDHDEALAFARKIWSQGIDRPQIYERGSPVPLSGAHRAPLSARDRRRRIRTRRRDPARHWDVADAFDEERDRWRDENETWPVLRSFATQEEAEDYAETLNERAGWINRFRATGPWGGGRDPRRARRRRDPHRPSSFQARLYETRLARESVNTDFLPLFDHLIRLAESDHRRGDPQGAGRYLAKARRLVRYGRTPRYDREYDTFRRWDRQLGGRGVGIMSRRVTSTVTDRDRRRARSRRSR